MPRNRKIRVLIVDDSAIVRKILSETIAADPDLEVVGTAPDPIVAREKISSLEPDVLTLDIEMPRMDGLTFLRQLMHFHPMPTIIISSLAQPSCRAAIEALELGAVEVLGKPAGPYSVGELRNHLASKIRAAAGARLVKQGPKSALSPSPSLRKTPAPPETLASPQAVIAIGASTGGTEAIASVLRAFPRNAPGTVVVQHIPAQFSRAFAGRLNELCEIDVKEAEDGDVLRPGLALIAPGDYHMLLNKGVGRYSVTVKTGPRVCYQRPSVDVLFCSVADVARSCAVGAILTGMGSDGAQGLLKMRGAGAQTLAQDENSCVVFGMPREAIQIGAADKVVCLDRMAQAILAACPARVPRSA